jgi:hypothetical protein
MIRRWSHKLDLDVQMLRLLAEGHHVDTCAQLLGVPANTVRGRRQATRRYLKALCRAHNLDISHIDTSPDPYRGIRARCAYPTKSE